MPPAASQAASDSPYTTFWLTRPLKLLQVANVDQFGFAPLVLKSLGGLGGSRERPIILKLGKPQVWMCSVVSLVSVKQYVLFLSGYLKGWSKLPPISALRQRPALQQKLVT